jgi:hypothetical protein
MKQYAVLGYDKDADVYETLWETDDYDNALMQCDIFYWRNQKEPIRRESNNEPFDWFEIQRTIDNARLYCV